MDKTELIDIESIRCHFPFWEFETNELLTDDDKIRLFLEYYCSAN